MDKAQENDMRREMMDNNPLSHEFELMWDQMVGRGRSNVTFGEWTLFHTCLSIYESARYGEPDVPAMSHEGARVRVKDYLVDQWNEELLTLPYVAYHLFKKVLVNGTEMDALVDRICEPAKGRLDDECMRLGIKVPSPKAPIDPLNLPF